MSPHYRACAVRQNVLLAILIAAFYVPLHAQSQTGYQHIWSTRLVPNSNAISVDVATDTQGNPVVVGTLGNEIYLAKYSLQNGSIVWSRRFNKSGILQNMKLAVGSSGNIVLGMGLNGAVDFGNGLPLGTGGGGLDFVTAKFDPTGVVLWSRRFGTANDELLFSIGINNAEDVWIGGTFSGSFSLSQSTFTSAGAGDALIIRFASFDGVPLSAARFGFSSHDIGSGMAVDGGGNVLLTGYLNNGQSVFITKFSGTGTQLWSNIYTRASGATSGSASGSAIAVTLAGDSYLIGSFTGQVDLGGKQLTSAGLGDIFLAKFSINGSLLYATRYGGGSDDSCRELHLDSNGDLILTGGFSNTTELGGGILTSAGLEDIYLVKLAGRDGTHIFSRRFGGAGSDQGVGLAVDNHNLILTGNFTGTLDFGNATLNGAGIDGFVAKFGQVAIPSIFENGVVNNASFAPGISPLAPGSIAAIFGSNLTDGSSVLNSSFGPDNRLITSLGGASVRINDIAAPIFYATPSQLGIQIPYELAGQTSATVQVTVSGIQSTPRSISLDSFVPGVFTVNQNGSGAAAVLHGIESTPVTAQNPARPGEVVVLFTTGLGVLAPALATGAPSTGNRTFVTPSVTIDGIPAEVQFSGAAPGFVGLNQVNVRISLSARATSEALLVLSGNGRQSNPTIIAIGQ